MRQTVLLFNIYEKERCESITRALLPLGIRIKKINKEDYLQPVGYLAGIKSINPIEDIYDGKELEGEMLFMANMGSRDVDNLIIAFRKSKLSPVSHKAVLTESNQYWNALQLFDELHKEYSHFHQPSE
ncbi:MAG TPA: DUF3783 domain-containing protein [Mobilitalea sp.]|nr:DUF3783 domain-containing protein [Mobilitalea sp.]